MSDFRVISANGFNAAEAAQFIAEKVAEALSDGYELHGSLTQTMVAVNDCMVVGRALVPYFCFQQAVIKRD